MNKTCNNPGQRFELGGSDGLCGRGSIPMKNRLAIHGDSPASGDGKWDTAITSKNHLFVKNNRITGDESEMSLYPTCCNISFVILVGVLLLNRHASLVEASDAEPNIVFIFVDDKYEPTAENAIYCPANKNNYLIS